MAAHDGLLSRSEELVCWLAIREATAEVVRCSAVAIPTAADTETAVGIATVRIEYSTDILLGQFTS